MSERAGSQLLLLYVRRSSCFKVRIRSNRLGTRKNVNHDGTRLSNKRLWARKKQKTSSSRSVDGIQTRVTKPCDQWKERPCLITGQCPNEHHCLSRDTCPQRGCCCCLLHPCDASLIASHFTPKGYLLSHCRHCHNSEDDTF